MPGDSSAAQEGLSAGRRGHQQGLSIPSFRCDSATTVALAATSCWWDQVSAPLESSRNLPPPHVPFPRQRLALLSAEV